MSKRLTSRARDSPSPFGICETTLGVRILIWPPQDTKDMDITEASPVEGHQDGHGAEAQGHMRKK